MNNMYNRDRVGSGLQTQSPEALSWNYIMGSADGCKIVLKIGPPNPRDVASLLLNQDKKEVSPFPDSSSFVSVCSFPQVVWNWATMPTEKEGRGGV